MYAYGENRGKNEQVLPGRSSSTKSVKALKINQRNEGKKNGEPLDLAGVESGCGLVRFDVARYKFRSLVGKKGKGRRRS